MLHLKYFLTLTSEFFTFFRILESFLTLDSALVKNGCQNRIQRPNLPQGINFLSPGTQSLSSRAPEIIKKNFLLYDSFITLRFLLFYRSEITLILYTIRVQSEKDNSIFFTFSSKNLMMALRQTYFLSVYLESGERK